MIKTYEYMLIDLATYKEVVNERGRDGWRLIRISTPAIGSGKGWGLIFERNRGA